MSSAQHRVFTLGGYGEPSSECFRDDRVHGPPASYALNPHETALGIASLVLFAMFNIPSYRAQ